MGCGRSRESDSQFTGEGREHLDNLLERKLITNYVNYDIVGDKHGG
jgi:hypothetical protein